MTLRGVRFGDYHTVNDWGLILNAKQINPPEPKTIKVPIDGRDGDLDISEAITGEIKYNNRSASFTFLVTEGTYYDRNSMITLIIGSLHGRKTKIILDDDYSHYLYGRVSVSNVENNKAYGTIGIECDCDPWKYAVNETISVVEVSGTSIEFVLWNGGIKKLIPEITIDGEVTLIYGEKRASFSSGKYKLTDLILTNGSNLFRLEGSGTATFTYREAIL